jgi:hypothetical protein
MEDVGTFYDHLVYCTIMLCIIWPFGIFLAIWYILGHLIYFMAIWYILWSFGIFYGHLVYFPALVC